MYKNKGYSTYTTRIERVKITKHVKYGNDERDLDNPFIKDVTGGVAPFATAASAEEMAEEIPF